MGYGLDRSDFDWLAGICTLYCRKAEFKALQIVRRAVTWLAFFFNCTEQLAHRTIKTGFKPAPRQRHRALSRFQEYLHFRQSLRPGPRERSAFGADHCRHIFLAQLRMTVKGHSICLRIPNDCRGNGRRLEYLLSKRLVSAKTDSAL